MRERHRGAVDGQRAGLGVGADGDEGVGGRGGGGEVTAPSGGAGWRGVGDVLQRVQRRLRRCPDVQDARQQQVGDVGGQAGDPGCGVDDEFVGEPVAQVGPEPAQERQPFPAAVPAGAGSAGVWWRVVVAGQQDGFGVGGQHRGQHVGEEVPRLVCPRGRSRWPNRGRTTTFSPGRDVGRR